MEDTGDIELVELARKGDKEAVGLLFQRYQMLTQRLAMRMVSQQDLAQELAQEAMLQAYLSLNRLHDPARFKGWLCGIVLNVCRSYLRNQKIAFFSLEAMAGGLELEFTPFLSLSIALERIAEERELHQTVIHAVYELTPGERDVTLLYYYNQLSIQEIAALQDITVSAVKVRLHRARQRLKSRILTQYPEIIPYDKRRKIMIKVTIADVVKKERIDEQGHPQPHHIILLHDEAGHRALPIWVGPFEGQSIVMGLNEFSPLRPMTFDFMASLLQGIKAEVEEVRIESLKGYIFYAVVKIRCGPNRSEVDARPSDALALAVRTGSPIYAAEDVLERSGVAIPEEVKTSALRSGVESILKEIGEMQRQRQAQYTQPMSQEEFMNIARELISSVFKT